MELLLRLIKEYKTKCEFNGIDFEADTQSMYTEIRRSMGKYFPEYFGLEAITEPDKDLRIMGSEEYNSFTKKRKEEQELIASIS